MKILLTTMFSLITIMLLTNSISLAQQESDTEAGTTTPTTYRNNEGRLIYEKDNMPCYFFEEIVVEHTQYNYNANDNLLIQNAVVYSKCISNEGEEWLKGKKSPGAQDVSHLLDHKRPSYLIFRAQLIEKTINNEDPPIIIGWDNEIDGEIFTDFIENGVDTINFDDIQESWNSEPQNDDNNDGGRIKKNLLSYDNGATITILNKTLPVKVIPKINLPRYNGEASITEAYNNYFPSKNFSSQLTKLFEEITGQPCSEYNSCLQELYNYIMDDSHTPKEHERISQIIKREINKYHLTKHLPPKHFEEHKKYGHTFSQSL